MKKKIPKNCMMMKLDGIKDLVEPSTRLSLNTYIR